MPCLPNLPTKWRQGGTAGLDQATATGQAVSHLWSHPNRRAAYPKALLMCVRSPSPASTPPRCGRGLSGPRLGWARLLHELIDRRVDDRLLDLSGQHPPSCTSQHCAPKGNTRPLRASTCGVRAPTRAQAAGLQPLSPQVCVRPVSQRRVSSRPPPPARTRGIKPSIVLGCQHPPSPSP